MLSELNQPIDLDTSGEDDRGRSAGCGEQLFTRDEEIAMTIQELIYHLQDFDPNNEVCLITRQQGRFQNDIRGLACDNKSGCGEVRP